MKCEKCSKDAVLQHPTLCKEHLMSGVVKKVKLAVSKYKLFSPKHNLIIALSGGKDSLSLMQILKTNFPNKLQAILIDEGIPGYRNLTVEAAKKYCTQFGVPLTIKSFFDEFKFKVINLPGRYCSYCGVFRRYLLNKTALELSDENTRIVTAHNLDDEVQSVIMNLFQNDYERFLRCGPISGMFDFAGEEKPKNFPKKFVPRIKPYRLVSERESAVYFYLSGMRTGDKECPNAKFSYRVAMRDAVNDFSYSTDKLFKKKILAWFDAVQTSLKSSVLDYTLNECANCGEPSSGVVCKSCEMIKELKAIGVINATRN